MAFQNFSFLNQPSHTSTQLRKPIDPNEGQLRSHNLQKHFDQIRQQSEPRGFESRDHQSDRDLILNLQSQKLYNGFDIRDMAPQIGAEAKTLSLADRAKSDWRGPRLSAPDLNLAGSLLFEQSLRPSLRPIEDEWVGKANRYLAGFFPVESDEWPTSETDLDESSGPRSQSPDGLEHPFPELSPAFPGLPSNPDDRAEQPEAGAFSWKTYRPRNIRFLRANEIAMGFSSGAQLSCEIGPGGSRFRLSRPMTTSTSIDLHHDTHDNRNSMGLKVSW